MYANMEVWPLPRIISVYKKEQHSVSSDESHGEIRKEIISTLTDNFNQSQLSSRFEDSQQAEVLKLRRCSDKLAIEIKMQEERLAGLKQQLKQLNIKQQDQSNDINNLFTDPKLQTKEGIQARIRQLNSDTEKYQHLKQRENSQREYHEHAVYMLQRHYATMNRKIENAQVVTHKGQREYEVAKRKNACVKGTMRLIQDDLKNMIKEQTLTAGAVRREMCDQVDRYYIKSKKQQKKTKYFSNLEQKAEQKLKRLNQQRIINQVTYMTATKSKRDIQHLQQIFGTTDTFEILDKYNIALSRNKLLHFEIEDLGTLREQKANEVRGIQGFLTSTDYINEQAHKHDVCSKNADIYYNNTMIQLREATQRSHILDLRLKSLENTQFAAIRGCQHILNSVEGADPLGLFGPQYKLYVLQGSMSKRRFEFQVDFQQLGKLMVLVQFKLSTLNAVAESRCQKLEKKNRHRGRKSAVTPTQIQGSKSYVRSPTIILGAMYTQPQHLVHFLNPIVPNTEYLYKSPSRISTQEQLNRASYRYAVFENSIISMEDAQKEEERAKSTIESQRQRISELESTLTMTEESDEDLEYASMQKERKEMTKSHFVSPSRSHRKKKQFYLPESPENKKGVRNVEYKLQKALNKFDRHLLSLNSMNYTKSKNIEQEDIHANLKKKRKKLLKYVEDPSKNSTLRNPLRSQRSCDIISVRSNPTSKPGSPKKFNLSPTSTLPSLKSHASSPVASPILSPNQSRKSLKLKRRNKSMKTIKL